jgi:hypothetical protein
LIPNNSVWNREFAKPLPDHADLNFVETSGASLLRPTISTLRAHSGLAYGEDRIGVVVDIGVDRSCGCWGIGETLSNFVLLTGTAYCARPEQQQN